MVAAASLGASIQCEEFAAAHTSTSHYDPKSFVGLAWRPNASNLCCEIYSTGKANLPGCTCFSDILAAWVDMLPELLLYSSRHEHNLLDTIDTEEAHVVGKPRSKKRPGSASSKACKSVFDDWLLT